MYMPDVESEFSQEFMDKVIEGNVFFQKIKGKGQPRVMPVQMSIYWEAREVIFYAYSGGERVKALTLKVPEVVTGPDADLCIKMGGFYMSIVVSD